MSSINTEIFARNMYIKQKKKIGKGREGTRIVQGWANLASSLVSLRAIVVLTGVHAELRPQ
jgi:hypothetical protein